MTDDDIERVRREYQRQGRITEVLLIVLAGAIIWGLKVLLS